MMETKTYLLTSKFGVLRRILLLVMALFGLVFFWQAQAQTYCVSSAHSGSNEYITNVTYAGIDNTTSSHEGYNDFTAQTASVFQGVTNQISVGINANSSEYVYVFIDWNQNGTLDDAGEAYTLASGTSSDGPHTRNISVPSDAVNGNTRMRVMVVWAGSSPDPCPTNYFGETEDYTVNVGTPSCAPPQNLSVSVFGSDIAAISWDTPTTGESNGLFRKLVAGDNTVPTSGFETSPGGSVGSDYTSLSPDTDYYFWIKSDCGNEESGLAMIRFHTPCTPAALPYSEGFEGVEPPAIPYCANTENVGDANDWETSSYSVPAGYTGNVLSYDSDYDTTNPANTWFFTEGVQLTAGTDYQVIFKYGDVGSVQKLKVSYGTFPQFSSMTTELADYTTDGDLTVINEPSIDFTVDADGVYYFGFNAHSDADQGRLLVDDILIRETPICLAPSGLTVDAVTDDSADISWTTEGTENNWVVKYSDTPGFDPTSAGMTANVSGMPSTQLTSLTANTTYEFYVKADCGSSIDESPFEGPVSFITDCETIIAPWTYDVESQPGTSKDEDVDPCWTANPNNGNDYSWRVTGTGTTTSSDTGPGAAHSGDKFFFTESADGSQGDVAELFSPLVDVSSFTTPYLSFYYHMYGADMGEMKVSVYDGSTWNLIETFTGEQQPAQDDDWMEATIALTGYTGLIQLKFEGTRGPGLNGDIAIDDIAIVEAPACSQPMDLTVATAAVNSADISWEQSANETNWVVKYSDTPGFDPTSEGMTANVSGTPSTQLTSLTANTTYEFYVRADCGYDISSFAGPVSFHTYCKSTPSSVLGNGLASAKVGDKSYTSNGDDVSYEDFSSEAVADLQAGAQANVQIQYDMGLRSPYFTEIWIDFNDDSVFDNSEKVFEEEAAISDVNFYDAFFMMPASAAVGNHRMRVASSPYGFGTTDACYNGIYGLTIDFTINVTSAPSCLPPDGDGFTLSNLTSTSVDVSWSPRAGETSWVVNYGPPGSDPETSGTPINVDGSPQTTLTGLSPDTTYRFYVKADCGNDDLSPFTKSQRFKTACVAANLPYSEDFENIEVPYDPGCIVTENAGEGSDWETAGVYDNGFGSKVMRYEQVYYPADAWFFTRGIELESGTDYQILYDYGNNSTSSTEKLKVAYGTSTNSTDMNNQLANYPTISDGTVKQDTIDFTVPASGTYYFGFNAYSDASQDELYVDNIEVRSRPCDAPTNVMVDASAENSAEVVWTPGANESDWVVKYSGNIGFDPTSEGMVKTVSGSPNTTIDGLAIDTTYELYIKADCGAGSGNNFTGPISFTTNSSDFNFIINSGLNADVIAEGDGPSENFTSQDFDGQGYHLVSETYQAPYEPNPASFGLPANGILQNQSAEGPDSYRLKNYAENNAFQLRLSSDQGSLQFANPTAIAEMYLLLSSSFGVGIEGTINFQDGSTQDIGSIDVPDWFNSSDLPVVYQGFGRLDPNDDYHNPTDNPRFYQATIAIDAANFNKQVKGVTLNRTDTGNGVFNLMAVGGKYTSSCVAPVGITTTNITTATVDVGWTPIGPESNWVVVYGETGFDTTDPSAYQTKPVSGSPEATLSSLSPGTAYEVYVKVDCDGSAESQLSDPEGFVTACTPIGDFSEDFDSTPDGEVPLCWSTLKENSTNPYIQLNVLSFNGAPSSPNSFYFANETDGSAVFYLISPELNNLTAAGHQLRFLYNGDYDAYDNLVVGTISDPTDKETFTPVETLNTTDGFSEYVVTLDQSYTDNFIAFQVTFNGTYANAILDNVNWEPIPTCVKPQDLTVGATTETTADISWSPAGPESNWVIKYSNDLEFDPTSEGMVKTVSGSPSTQLTGLTGNVYKLYVKADCGGGDESIFTGPKMILTPPANDALCDAIPLIVGKTSTGDDYSNIGATVQNNEPSGSCWYDGDAAQTSVWFSFEAPDSGNVTITTDIPGGNLMDSQMALYEAAADCADLSTLGAQMGCSEDDGYNNSLTSVITTAGLTPGNTYYIQVDGYDGIMGTFGIMVRDNDSFTYVNDNVGWIPSDPNTDATATDNITVNEGTASFHQDMTVNGIIINDGATLNIEKILTVNDDIINEGNMVFKSTATSDGELAEVPSGSAITGDVVVERYFSDNRAFRLVSSPVTTSTSIHANWQEGAVSATDDPNPGYGTHITGTYTNDQENGFDITASGNPSLFTLNVGDQVFDALANTDVNTLAAGDDYLLYVRGDRSIDLTDNTSHGSTILRSTGALHTGGMTQNLGNIEGGNFVAIANPYQSAIDVTSVIGNSTNLNGNYAYVYDPTLGTYGAYATVDLSSGTANGSTANQYIQPGQAVQVAVANTGSAQIVFSESDKAPGNHTTTFGSENPFMDNTHITGQLFTAANYAANKPMHDGFSILFNDNFDNAFNSADAVKAFNFTENMGIGTPDSAYSIEKRQLPEEGEAIALFNTGYNNQDYRLVLEVSDFEDTTPYLVDTYTGEETVLEAGGNALSFTVDPSLPESVATDRFYIHFRPSTLSDDNQTVDYGIELYPNPAKSGSAFYIKAGQLDDQHVNVKVTDLLGKTVYSVQKYFDNGKVTIQPDSPLGSGVYFVSLAQDGKTVNKRLVVK